MGTTVGRMRSRKLVNPPAGVALFLSILLMSVAATAEANRSDPRSGHNPARLT